MPQEKARVVVEVSGGVVQEIFSHGFVEVVLVDWDNIDASLDENGLPTEEAFIWDCAPDDQMSKETSLLVNIARGSTKCV